MNRAEALAYRRKIEHAASQQSDEDALQSIELFPKWNDNFDAVKDERRSDLNANGELALYKCLQSHHTQAGWRPKDTPALWTEVSVEEWPEWVQPAGEHDAYAKGDKVAHNGKHWISDYAGANVWEPGVYGWSEATN